MEINLLRDAIDLLEKALGSDLIRKEVHKMNGWNPESQSNLHPLVRLWYKSKEDLALAELTGNLPNSKWVQQTIKLGDFLKSSSPSNYQEILNKLTNLLEIE